jgi:hypothetical protein
MITQVVANVGSPGELPAEDAEACEHYHYDVAASSASFAATDGEGDNDGVAAELCDDEGQAPAGGAGSLGEQDDEGQGCLDRPRCTV